MKSVKGFLPAVFLVIISASSAAYSATASPAGFEQRKAEQISRIDIRIRQLQEEKELYINGHDQRSHQDMPPAG